MAYGAGAAQLKQDWATGEKPKSELAKRFASFNADRWDNPEDQITIRIGFTLYNEYAKTGRTPTGEQILMLLDAADFSSVDKMYAQQKKTQKNKTLHSNNCKGGVWTEPKDEKDK